MCDEYIRIQRFHLRESTLSAEELTEKPSSAGLQVAVVGVGGAGNNLLSHAIESGISPKNCVAVGTDRNQLSSSDAQNKVLLNEPTSSNVDWLRRESSDFRLMAYRVSPFTRESDFTILLTGLGGVVGTVAGPVIAQINRSQVRPVVSVVALPFIHERERRLVALRGLKRMVEACDCTVVVDNAVQSKSKSGSERAADEAASLAVKGLSEVVAMGSHTVSNRVLSILRLGQVATICRSRVSFEEPIQSAIIEALEAPSANLPLNQAKGAVLLIRGLEQLDAVLANRAYQALVSLIGHAIEFVQLSVRSEATPSVTVFLTGYSYGATLATFVDFIEDLYDMEYGVASGVAEVDLPSRLYQMEGIR